eukprot:2751257-Rhodomonas_salina.5
MQVALPLSRNTFRLKRNDPEFLCKQVRHDLACSSLLYYRRTLCIACRQLLVREDMVVRLARAGSQRDVADTCAACNERMTGD